MPSATHNRDDLDDLGGLDDFTHDDVKSGVMGVKWGDAYENLEIICFSVSVDVRTNTKERRVKSQKFLAAKDSATRSLVKYIFSPQMKMIAAGVNELSLPGGCIHAPPA